MHFCIRDGFPGPPYFLKTVLFSNFIFAFFYLLTKTLDLLHGLAQMMPLGPSFLIFQKYAFLHP
jgi:hypothetical protein